MQLRPQAPQLVRLLVRSVHAPPQRPWPVGHAQTPAVHVVAPAQRFPQMPQLVLLVCGLMQTPPQRS